jgi:hypothetical protein
VLEMAKGEDASWSNGVVTTCEEPKTSRLLTSAPALSRVGGAARRGTIYKTRRRIDTGEMVVSRGCFASEATKRECVCKRERESGLYFAAL